MTSSINCYNDLGIKISRLTLQDYQSTPTSHPENLSTVFAGIIEATALGTNPTFEQPSDDIYEFSGLYDSLPMDFDIFVKIRFDHSSEQYSLLVSILNNGRLYRVQNRDQRLLLNKFFLKANSTMMYGGFRLHPVTGQVKICFTCSLTTHEYKKLLSEPQKFTLSIEEDLLKVKFYLRAHLYKMLYLMNDIKINFPRDPYLSGMKTRQISQNIAGHRETLRKFIPFLHLEFPYMYAQGHKMLKTEDVKRMGNRIQAVKLSTKEIDPEIIKIMKLYSPLPGFKRQMGDNFSDKEKEKIAKALQLPGVKYAEGEPLNIYSEIRIEKCFSGWDKIDEGGFGMISKGIVRANYPSIANGSFSIERALVRKEEIEGLQQNKQKMKHEKRIIEQMKNGVCPFIGKFFYCQNEEYKDSLFIQYCKNGSLAHFHYLFKDFLGLSTKLLILKYIAHGMKFLKDRDIYHLDLKPSNILFGITHVKITDFGESYHPNICPKNFRPGASLPYAPPQSLSGHQIHYTDRMDIFSFGIIIYEMIFGSYPLEFNSFDYNRIKRAYRQKTYPELFFIAPQRSSLIGTSIITQNLGLLAMRCLQERESRRPCIEWIIVFLQYCIYMMEELNL